MVPGKSAAASAGGGSVASLSMGPNLTASGSLTMTQPYGHGPSSLLPLKRGFMPSEPNHPNDILTALDIAEAFEVMPTELTKTFGDLRELDAVLNATITHLTERLTELTDMLDPTSNASGSNKKSRPVDRFQLLLSIAEELTRYKLGSDDKIKVAGQACDLLVTQQHYVSQLIANSTLLVPHPSSSTTNAANSLAQANVPPSASKNRSRGSPHPSNRAASTVPEVSKTPTKKRKKASALAQAVGDDWEEESVISGRKGSPALGSSTLSANQSTSAGGKKNVTTTSAKEKKSSSVPNRKKNSRDSPAESTTGSMARAASHDATDVTAGEYSEAERKQVRPSPAPSASTRTGHDSSSAHAGEVTAKASKTKSSSSKSKYGASGLPNPVEMAVAHAKKIKESSNVKDRAQATKRNGAGTGSADRGTGKSKQNGIQSAFGEGEGEAETVEDADTSPYCYCRTAGYGAMIGCDADDCEIQWFHLGCVDLLAPPAGDWFCPDCEERQSKLGKKGKKSAKSKRR